MVKNYMEIVVDDVLPTVLKEHELKCGCERCVEDIKAITLNNLKPTYVASDKGIVYGKLNEMGIQFKADVISAIMMAIKKVEERPSH